MKLFRIITSGAFSEYKIEGAIEFNQSDLPRLEAAFKEAATLPNDQRKKLVPDPPFPGVWDTFKAIIKRDGFNLTIHENLDELEWSTGE